jgi:hypothetical protein
VEMEVIVIRPVIRVDHQVESMEWICLMAEFKMFGDNLINSLIIDSYV